MADSVAIVLMFGVTAYALFAGADFGAGFWDLTAGSAHAGARPRSVFRPRLVPGQTTAPPPRA